eukprot:6210236-Pleurochrysis_carterae.AAC.1
MRPSAPSVPRVSLPPCMNDSLYLSARRAHVGLAFLALWSTLCLSARPALVFLTPPARCAAASLHPANLAVLRPPRMHFERCCLFASRVQSEAACLTAISTSGWHSDLGKALASVEVMTGLAASFGSAVGGALFEAGGATAVGSFAFPCLTMAMLPLAAAPVALALLPAKTNLGGRASLHTSLRAKSRLRVPSVGRALVSGESFALRRKGRRSRSRVHAEDRPAGTRSVPFSPLPLRAALAPQNIKLIPSSTRPYRASIRARAELASMARAQWALRIRAFLSFGRLLFESHVLRGFL